MVSPTEKIAAKTMGTVKAAKATLEGLTGVFRELAREHGEVSALLLRVKMSSDPKLRAELFPTIRSELLAHENSEQDVVYSALADHPETQLMVAQHRRDAAELEKLLEQLRSLPYDDELWVATFETLVDSVQRHASQEENEFFPTAERVLDAHELETLQPRYEAAKADFAPQVH